MFNYIKNIKNIKKITVSIVFFSIIAPAHAGIIVYDDRSIFDTQGNIIFNNDFEQHTDLQPYEEWVYGSGSKALGYGPYTEQGVTYTNEENIIFGMDSYYTDQSNHITNNYTDPVNGLLNVASNFNMFAFDFGVSGIDGQEEHRPDMTTYPIGYDLALTLISNLATYSFTVPTAPDARFSPLKFWGFKLDEGEYFSEFTLSQKSLDDVVGESTVVFMDNVTLGNTERVNPDPRPVPEPTSLALFVLAFMGIYFSKKKNV